MGTQIPNIDDTRELLKKNQIGIIGVGETEQGKIPGKSSFHFLSEASKLAIEDAGIQKSDVDGIITAFSLVEETFMHCTTFADYIGITPKYFESVAIGGAMANTFLLANNYNVGKSLVEKDLIQEANNIQSKAKKSNCELILPTDVLCGKNINDKNPVYRNIHEILSEEMILDLSLIHI
mgnify:CR=1 FL=1